MTSELNSIKPKELKKLQGAVKVIKNVYGLDDEEIDAFFVLCKNAKEFTEMMKGVDRRLLELEKAYLNTTKQTQIDAISRLQTSLNEPRQEFKRV